MTLKNGIHSRLLWWREKMNNASTAAGCAEMRKHRKIRSFYSSQRDRRFTRVKIRRFSVGITRKLCKTRCRRVERFIRCDIRVSRREQRVSRRDQRISRRDQRISRRDQRISRRDQRISRRDQKSCCWRSKSGKIGKAGGKSEKIRKRVQLSGDRVQDSVFLSLKYRSRYGWQPSASRRRPAMQGLPCPAIGFSTGLSIPAPSCASW